MKYFRSLLVVAAIAFASVAHAAGEYTVTSSASDLGGNTWQFDYTITNVNQGTAGSTYGFDGFAIFIPETAIVVSTTSPAPYAGSPGYWGFTVSPTTDPAFSGYSVGQWWGYNVESVYPTSSVVNFSITLNNVASGSNAAGLASYWGFSSEPSANFFNSYGNYTLYVTTIENSPIAAVPEPESYAMLLLGVGFIGLLARRRKNLLA
ncbi:MAG: PEP-CTERM sorting domain-containing protein [Methylophilaceae bacterium]